MTTGPDGKGAAAHGLLRAAHADREQVIAVLKAAFVQGRLTKDELEARAGQAFAAKTYAELATLTADIPVGLPAVPVGGSGGPGAGSAAPRPATTPARTLGLAARRSGIWLLVTVTLVEAAFATGSSFFLVLAFIAFMAVSCFLGRGIFDARRETRSRGQRPHPPGAWPRPPERSPRPG